jgi:NTP pyrophosphatase (non-canonical NTP hydrolase)
MARKRWKGLHKVTEECSELIQELMKLYNYPDGKHPRRRRSLKISTQEEAGDVLGSLQYFVERNGLDLEAIEKRRAMKYRKWLRRYGETAQSKKAKKSAKKRANKRTSKKSPKVKMPGVDVSSIIQTLKTT